MDYVEQWKRRELEGYKIALAKWKEKLEQLQAEEDIAKEEFQQAKKDYAEKHNGNYPETVNGRFTDETVHQAYRKRKYAEDVYISARFRENRFFAEYGFRNDFEERAKKEIERHFNQLQSKVEKKIGKIIKIESFGGDDYAFEGEKGDCIVEVIWAGGYNIQRLHTRWIVKNWNIEE